MTGFWHHRFPAALLAVGMTGLLSITGCASAPPAASSPSAAPITTSDAKANDADENAIIHFAQETAGVPQPGQQLFATPEQAAAALKDAVAAKDRRTLVAIFGSEGKELIFAGDRVQENNDLTAMAARMSEYLHLDRASDSLSIVRIGKENWPFPIPIVKSNGGWFYDTVAGRDELLNRRIGEDELNAIAVCRAYVAAQHEYARKDRTGEGVIQYAQHVMSRPGKRDGLYWEPGAGEELSPMGPLIAEARLEGYPETQPTNGKPHPYQGYIFHILKAQGPAAPGGEMSYVVNDKMTKGFALIASPSKYGASGMMTFIVAQDGKVYQKNLGEKTREIVATITQYNPDNTWEEVKD